MRGKRRGKIGRRKASKQRREGAFSVVAAAVRLMVAPTMMLVLRGVDRRGRRSRARLDGESASVRRGHPARGHQHAEEQREGEQSQSEAVPKHRRRPSRASCRFPLQLCLPLHRDNWTSPGVRKFPPM
jgi:hypothetical protein